MHAWPRAPRFLNALSLPHERDAAPTFGGIRNLESVDFGFVATASHMQLSIAKRVLSGRE